MFLKVILEGHTHSSLNFKDQFQRLYTTNEGPVRIQYICLVPIYVFPEMNLLFPKQNVLSLSSFYTLISRFIYFKVGSAYSAAGKYMD
jgi:hypothetical protein